MKHIEHEVDEFDKLTPAGATSYRAVSARCNYLAQDRVDLAYSATELCRDVAVPTLQSLSKLKHMLRYLKGRPRLVYHYNFQVMPSTLGLCVDTDFAGCKVTRRSASGGAAIA